MTDAGSDTLRLARIDLDAVSLTAANAEIEHERRVAIYDLIETNRFAPAGAERGPFGLTLSLQDNRLVFDIVQDGEAGGFSRTYALSLTPLKKVIKDYLMICESYYEALRGSSPSQIEAVDMGRRGLHNEGAEHLTERLQGKVVVDHETARRLFTLICALYRRG